MQHPITRVALSIVLINWCALSAATEFAVDHLKPYSFEWYQCSHDGTSWQPAPRLTERLSKTSAGLWHLEQSSLRPDQNLNQFDVTLNAPQLTPKAQNQRVVSPDGTVLYEAKHQFTDSGYTGTIRTQNQSKEVSGLINNKMVQGGMLGLPLATISPQTEPFEIEAAMLQFDGTYRVTATWVGTEAIQHGTHALDVHMVDVNWLHHESGDVYPGGPNQSGGRYWLLANPPADLPFVLRYQTDTYAVEFHPKVCPVGTTLSQE